MLLGTRTATEIARRGTSCWDRAPTYATALWMSMLRCVRVPDGAREAVDEIVEKAQLRSVRFTVPKLHPDAVLSVFLRDGADPTGGAFVVATREGEKVHACLCYARVRRGMTETDPSLDYLDGAREVHLLRGCPPDPNAVDGCDLAAAPGVVPLAPAVGVYFVTAQLLRHLPAARAGVSLPTLREAFENGVVCVAGVTRPDGGSGEARVLGEGVRWRDRFRGSLTGLEVQASGGGRALAWILVPHPRGDVRVGVLFPADGVKRTVRPKDFGLVVSA